MKHLRHWFGWLALPLGIIGMLACLAAIAGGWLWSLQARDSLDQMADRVTGLTSRLGDRSTEASDWLAQSQATITALQANVAAGLDTALGERGIDRQELESVLVQVRATIAQVREWMAVAESSGAVIELVRGVVDSLGALVSAEMRDGAGEALQETIAGVQQTRLALDELSAAIELARTDTSTGAAATARARSILSRSAGALDSLQGHSDTIGRAIGEVERTTLDLRSRLHQRLTLLLVVGTVLLLWQAVAQWSLARWGGLAVRTSGGHA